MPPASSPMPAAERFRRTLTFIGHERSFVVQGLIATRATVECAVGVVRGDPMSPANAGTVLFVLVYALAWHAYGSTFVALVCGVLWAVGSVVEYLHESPAYATLVLPAVGGAS